MRQPRDTDGEPPAPRHYFVDEAGDATLFDGKGRVIIGSEGCSGYFILGVLDVAAPHELTRQMEELRARLLADPYFRGVPSMQPEARKTAVGFHATDDPAEVRREVLSFLASADVHFLATVRDKRTVLDYVRSRNQVSSDYQYRPDELYDHMARRLFRDLLHRGSSHEVCFATRGKRDRTDALRAALERARQRFQQRWAITSEAPIRVWSCAAQRCACLQGADYFLWALQRLYERGEERYLGVLWPRFSLVVDMDDMRSKGYGVYYTQKRPLSAAALIERGQGI